MSLTTAWPTCLSCHQHFDGPGLQCDACRSGSARPGTVQPFPGSVRLVLPWAAFASDNLRKGVIGRQNRERQATYNDALALFRSKARAQYCGEPFAGPASVLAVFWVPDEKGRDHLNFAKILGDGLKGIVLTDDKWKVLRDARLRVEGVDRDDPRGEVLIKAIPQRANGRTSQSSAP